MRISMALRNDKQQLTRVDFDFRQIEPIVLHELDLNNAMQSDELVSYITDKLRQRVHKQNVKQFMSEVYLERELTQNVKLAIDKLIDLRILQKTDDNFIIRNFEEKNEMQQQVSDNTRLQNDAITIHVLESFHEKSQLDKHQMLRTILASRFMTPDVLHIILLDQKNQKMAHIMRTRDVWYYPPSLDLDTWKDAKGFEPSSDKLELPDMFDDVSHATIESRSILLE